jgi:hypothetical protein
VRSARTRALSVTHVSGPDMKSLADGIGEASRLLPSHTTGESRGEAGLFVDGYSFAGAILATHFFGRFRRPSITVVAPLSTALTYRWGKPRHGFQAIAQGIGHRARRSFEDLRRSTIESHESHRAEGKSGE